MEGSAAAGGVLGRVTRGVHPVPLLLVLLATVEPFISFLDRNREEYVQLNILMQLAFGALAVSLLVYVVLLVVFGRTDPRRLAAAQAAFVFCFFRYGDVFRDTDLTMVARLGGWVVLTGVVVATVALWSRLDGVRLFLVLFFAVTTVVPTLSYGSYELGKGEAAEDEAGPRAPIPVADEPARTPDVWWLMLDGYARADVLDAMHDFDNDPFLTELQDRGFRVSDDSYSSYPSTVLSISSVLELDHVASSPADLAGGIESVTGSLRGGGRVVDAFGEHGYRYVYADDGVYDIMKCDPSAVDVCLDARPGQIQIGHLARTVADLTPFAELRSDLRPDPVLAVERATTEMLEDQPELVFAHLLNPHEPLWYDDDCAYRSGSTQTDLRPDRYVHQIECLNPRVVQAVDMIVEADPEAIVIVQSDHGTGFLGKRNGRYKDYDEWSADAIAERYSILEAMKLPEACRTPQGDHSNVSTFEYVLACIEDREPEPIADRYFFWRKGVDELLEIEPPVAIQAD